jgi:hypothetical protein
VTRFLADENFNGIMVKALRRQRPDIDIVTIQELDMQGTSDPGVLEYASIHERLVLSGDKQTMIGFAQERIIVGKHMPGLVMVAQNGGVGAIVEELILIAECLQPHEWEGSIRHLPL